MGEPGFPTPLPEGRAGEGYTLSKRNLFSSGQGAAQPHGRLR